MRIRTIKPEFWEHPVMGRKSDATKLLAIGLLNVADDEGYFYADPKLIRNAIRPFDDESGITTVSIRELSEIGYIAIRKHPTHGDIGKVVAFLDHQVINKPKASKLRELHQYGIDTVLIPDEARLERKGKEGNGMEKEPPNPQGGFKMIVEKSEKTDPDRITIGRILGRRETTKWSADEIKLLKAIKPIHADDLGLIQRFYGASDIPKATDYRRTTIERLLRHWNGEVDKARIYLESK